jgi:hypothetical protein
MPLTHCTGTFRRPQNRKQPSLSLPSLCLSAFSVGLFFWKVGPCVERSYASVQALELDFCSVAFEDLQHDPGGYRRSIQSRSPDFRAAALHCPGNRQFLVSPLPDQLEICSSVLTDIFRFEFLEAEIDERCQLSWRQERLDFFCNVPSKIATYDE